MNRRCFAQIPVFIFAVLFLAACGVTPKLYFGQPVAAFNSKVVKRLLPVIQQKFPERMIEDPIPKIKPVASDR